MPDVFRIELLPARQGDCILIEYGDARAPRRVLVDGGPVQAFPALENRIAKIPTDQRTFELLVVTHIDSDHIGGIVKLLNHKELGLAYRDLWFNGWPQLSGGLVDRPFQQSKGRFRGVEEAVFLELRIEDAPWNDHFHGGPIFVPWTGELPQVELEGGLRLTLLSPSMEKLKKLQETWSDWFRNRGKDPEERESFQVKLKRSGAYRGAVEPEMAAASGVVPLDLDSELTKGPLDKAVANGSSLAFLAEYAGRCCALLGDAHIDVIDAAMQRLLKTRRIGRLPLDAMKLSHHGSQANLTDSFLRLVRCPRFLVSTDGSRFNHPDDLAIYRLLSGAPGCSLEFNYRSSRNEKWADPGQQERRGYMASYPNEGEEGICIDLLAAQPE